MSEDLWLIEVELGIGASNRQFYDLVWPQADMVLRYARVLSGSASDAEDLAQESLLKAYRAIDQFKPGTEIRAWLITILRHTHIDWVRKRATQHGTVSLDSLAYDPQGAESAAVVMPQDWEQEQTLLQQFGDAAIIDAMQRLPTEIRWTLLLVDVEGLDLKEAAEVTDVPLGTVKSRCHRGREMLKNELLRVVDRSDLVARSVRAEE